MARARCQRGVMGVVDIALASILPARSVYVLSLFVSKIRVLSKNGKTGKHLRPRVSAQYRSSRTDQINGRLSRMPVRLRVFPPLNVDNCSVKRKQCSSSGSHSSTSYRKRSNCRGGNQ
jgi:hypothetical protein